MDPIRNAGKPSGVPFNVDPDRTFDQTYLVNKLNHINFMGETVVAVFVHSDLEHDRRLPILPLPCSDSQLACRWAAGQAAEDLDSFRLGCLLVEDNGTTLLVNAELLQRDGDALLLQLPETCHPLHQKPARRRINPGLTAEIFQKGIRYTGRMVDYSAHQLDIAVSFAPPQTHHWIAPGTPVYLVLLENQETCYSATCVMDAGPSLDDSPVYRLNAEDKTVSPLPTKKIPQQTCPSLPFAPGHFHPSTEPSTRIMQGRRPLGNGLFVHRRRQGHRHFHRSDHLRGPVGNSR